jgi:hypothetical protein
MQSGTASSMQRTGARQDCAPRLTHSASLAAAWAAAGGTAGGALVSLLLLAGRMHPGGSATAALLLSVAGGCLGLVHGAILARLCWRDAGPTRRRDRVAATAVAAAALLGAALLSVWLTAGAVLARSGRMWGWVALLAGGLAASAVGLLATHLGWVALERSWTRWRERRLGSLLVVGAFVVTAATLLLLEPALPGGRTALTRFGWLAVAALATLWIATPLVILVTRRTAASSASSR